MLGLTSDAAQNLALLVAIALVLLAALFAKVLVGNLVKIVTAVVLVAAAVLVWSQRTSLQECVDRVRDEAGPTTTGTASCSVAGFDFTVDLGG